MRYSRMLSTLVLIGILGAGCAGLAKGPTDEELIAGVLSGWQQALLDQDLDALMTFYSDEYEGERGEGKEEVRDFLQGAMDQGYLDDIEVSLEDAETEMDGDTAYVGPVDLSSPVGEMALEVTLKKEDENTWRMISSSQY